MKDQKSVEEWADALLEQHRSAPRAGRADRCAGDRSLDREPLMMRQLIKLSVKLSGQPPDPEMLARMQRRRERFPRLRGVETALTWISIVVLCVVVYAAFRGPSFF